ncbi:MAG: hypothetical protein GY861_21360 [bacterium]|nr:hypothetical protein [bacterium]
MFYKSVSGLNCFSVLSFWLVNYLQFTMMLILMFSLFVMAAACYVMSQLADSQDSLGMRLGRLLGLPNVIVASVFQSLSTSMPEIAMAIIASGSFIASGWNTLEIGEKGSSGALNMIFSSADNAFGIGSIAVLLMIYKGFVRSEETVRVKKSVLISLFHYLITVIVFSVFITLGSDLSVSESWVMMILGLSFIPLQIFLIKYYKEENSEEYDAIEVSKAFSKSWFFDFTKTVAFFSFVVFGMFVLVEKCLGATFSMASVSFFSVGGILLLFTSYVSSFPEFVLAYRYANRGRKDELLAMLFASNAFDLAFSGFRAIRTGVAMPIYTTGIANFLLPYYIYILPMGSFALLYCLYNKKIKFGHFRYIFIAYLTYVFSGWILL